MSSMLAAQKLWMHEPIDGMPQLSEVTLKLILFLLIQHSLFYSISNITPTNCYQQETHGCYQEGKKKQKKTWLAERIQAQDSFFSIPLLTVPNKLLSATNPWM